MYELDQGWYQPPSTGWFVDITSRFYQFLKRYYQSDHTPPMRYILIKLGAESRWLLTKLSFGTPLLAAGEGYAGAE